MAAAWLRLPEPHVWWLVERQPILHRRRLPLNVVGIPRVVSRWWIVVLRPCMELLAHDHRALIVAQVRHRRQGRRRLGWHCCRIELPRVGLLWDVVLRCGHGAHRSRCSKRGGKHLMAGAVWLCSVGPWWQRVGHGAHVKWRVSLLLICHVELGCEGVSGAGGLLRVYGVRHRRSGRELPCEVAWPTMLRYWWRGAGSVLLRHLHRSTCLSCLVSHGSGGGCEPKNTDTRLLLGESYSSPPLPRWGKLKLKREMLLKKNLAMPSVRSAPRRTGNRE